MRIVFLIFIFLLAGNAYSQEAFKVDEYGNVPCDDYLGRMDGLFAESERNPTAKVYILLYEGKVPTYNYRTKRIELKRPIVGLAEARIRSIKRYADHRRFPKERLAFIKAGFRKEAALEAWIVPPGAKPPTPSETVPKMRYRPGKAAGYCVGCCLP
ncbi:MAG TPA: hypothetical protein VMZ26_16265 [Pyrinomonadaceae bacterium]|nr:hypothetical protein [Pyrinomonadaceae bacterium]